MLNIDEHKSNSELLRRELKTCPVCGEEFAASHRFAKIASVIVGASAMPDLTQLGDAIRERQWDRLVSMTEWDGDRDNMVVYAIACPHGSGTLVEIYDPEEFYESPHLYRAESLSSQCLAELSAHVPSDRWGAFT